MVPGTRRGGGFIPESECKDNAFFLKTKSFILIFTRFYKKVMRRCKFHYLCTTALPRIAFSYCAVGILSGCRPFLCLWLPFIISRRRQPQLRTPPRFNSLANAVNSTPQSHLTFQMALPLSFRPAYDWAINRPNLRPVNCSPVIIKTIMVQRH